MNHAYARRLLIDALSDYGSQPLGTDINAMSDSDLAAAAYDAGLNQDNDDINEACENLAGPEPELDPVAIRNAVEAAWLSRAAAQRFGKPTSAKYLNAEVEFFAGAMSAIQAMDPNAPADKLSSLVPPIWVVNAMTGRPIADPSAAAAAKRAGE